MKGLKIGVISLGCSKNRVDTENMLKMLQDEGAEFTADPEKAEVIIVNTCGFINDAKQESIDTILEMAEKKQTGTLRALIVTGCLSQRYQNELAEELPEVDAFLGVANYSEIASTVKRALKHQKTMEFSNIPERFDQATRILTTPPWYAYVKIAEGCNNRCSYCAIPEIRGPLKSRPMDEVIAEVRALVERGVQEIVLIAQDTTKYGEDLGQANLPELLKELDRIDGLRWIRILYSYPESVTPELVDTILNAEHIVHYLDIPVQHLEDTVLKRMNRRGRYADIERAVRLLRQSDPEFILRTTMIAGFPGETEEQVKILIERLQELAFDRVGVFAYSQEEGTPAAKFRDQVPLKVRARRRDQILQAQMEISKKRNESRIGKVYPVVIEEYAEGKWLGRSYAEAPEVDGKIYVNGGNIGQWKDVKIIQADYYDLMGECV